MNAFSEDERSAVYRAIAERRDIRNFRPDPIDSEVLLRILRAAHQAPSVGQMQPWAFVVVRDAGKRRLMYDHFCLINRHAAEQYQGDRQASYLALKLQGLLDAPLHLLVTCDTQRTQGPVLGRITMRHMDEYSTCLAVQNLWLAARAEGVGVGWMSIMEPAFAAETFCLPDGVLPVAYLALGYPVVFPPAPLLERSGWSRRMPLNDVIFDDQYGRRATGWVSGGEPMPQGPVAELEALGSQSAEQLEHRLDALTKPQGSLGRLEQLALQAARCQERMYPLHRDPTLLLFAGDHGVCAQGISAYLPVATHQMVYQYLAGGAATNVLCGQHDVELQVFDVGVNHDFGHATGLEHHKVRRGTRDFTRESAMTALELESAMEVGARAVRDRTQSDVVGLGEMGIGNTTSAAALAAYLLGKPAEALVGAGTGASKETRQRKLAAITQGLALHQPQSPTDALRCMGGLELAALVGAIEQAARSHKLVVLDGMITATAALVAARRTPKVAAALVASHCGAERAHAPLLNALGLAPLLALDLRLGEGSGAVLGMSLVRSAVLLARSMRTFEEVNLERPLDPRNRSA